MKTFGFLIIVSFLFGFVTYGQYPDSIRLNDIRFIASHNSYKLKPDAKVLNFLGHFKKRLGNDLDPKRMEYGHVSLTEQFDRYEVRGIELDLYYDPKGGKYRKRRVNLFVSGRKQRIKDSVMREPGFKMLHIADVDFETNYLTFKSALEEIKIWSNNNPTHIPLFINIEPKGDSPGDHSGFLRFLGFKRAIPYDSIAYSELEKEILDALPKERILTPKDLKGDYSSISHRLDSIGWPKLNEVLGKVIFVIDGDRNSVYKRTQANPLLFLYDDPSDSSTAFVKRNDPFDVPDEIAALTEKYMVRTRTDVETIQARENDYRMFDAAIKSEAQIISTDYYKEDEALSPFKADLKPYKSVKEWSFILRLKN